MSKLQIRKAQRSAAWIKIALSGVAGAGKTMSALRMAVGLSNGGKILLADTENASADLYADKFNFDKVDIAPPFEHTDFIDAAKMAVENGYKVLIVDSGSHLWKGVLEYKEALDARGGRQNGYTNWREPGKQFDDAVNTFLQSPIHIIVCLRSKTEYVQEDVNGKKQVRKVGLAPVFREGMDFEFSTVLDIGTDHFAVSSKDRTGLFGGRPFQITEDTGKELLKWMGSAGVKEQAAKPQQAAKVVEQQKADEPIRMVTQQQVETINQLLSRLPSEKTKRCPDPNSLTESRANDCIKWLYSMIPADA
jgi:hypothetical protein